MDASYLALLAQVLVLHDCSVALCDYHDAHAGYVHAAEDSLEKYAATCLSQVQHCLPNTTRDDQGRRVILIGHSLGGLVALRMFAKLQGMGVGVAGILTICTPVHGVPLLATLQRSFPRLSSFLKRCSTTCNARPGRVLATNTRSRNSQPGRLKCRVRTYSCFDPRRALGELVRVEVREEGEEEV